MLKKGVDFIFFGAVVLVILSCSDVLFEDGEGKIGFWERRDANIDKNMAICQSLS